MTRTAFSLPLDTDPCPQLQLVERGPKGRGVGRWVPDDKHTLLAKWQGGTRYMWAKWTERVYIDPFCGPGRIQVENEDFTRDGGALVAWRRSMVHQVPFTKVLIGDIDPDRCAACGQRLAALNAPVTSFVGPAVDTVQDMVNAVPRGALALAYVDPYNLAFLSFDILKTLAALPNVDLLVHFSTMDLQRNVDMELHDERARFDEAAPGWRSQVDVTQHNLVGLRQAFFEYWKRLVAGLGFTLAEQAPQIRGDRGEPLYRLMMFSRFPGANKIWNDVAKPGTMSLF